MDDIRHFLSQHAHECTAVIQQTLIYIHLFAFAFAIVTILSENARILVTRKLDSPRLQQVADRVTCLLAILWISGIALLSIEPGLNPYSILIDPNLAAKMSIVLILTANGLCLHLLVSPGLRSQKKTLRIMPLVCILTTISTTSWIGAGLIGAARAVAPMMNYQQYLVIYLTVLLIALLAVMFLVYPVMRTIIQSMHDSEFSSELPIGPSSSESARNSLSGNHGQSPHARRRAQARVERGFDIRSIMSRQELPSTADA